MSKHETAKAIADRAAEWVAKIDRSEADPAMLAELNTWLAGDDRRRGAYFRAQIAWNMLNRASALAGGLREGAEWNVPGVSRRRVLWAGGVVAASVSVALLGARLWRREPETIETMTGEIRRVPLNDGSLAAVNTQTRLSISLRPDIRRIALDHGEAWFQVAKDSNRPFIVEAGDARARAVGTAFSVRRMEDGAAVQVTEGVVEVWSIADPSNIKHVAAGSRAFVRDDAGAQQVAVASADIDRSLSWRSGQLIFDGQTLSEAASEFNRYNAVQVTVDDPGLAEEKLVGRFRTNEPEAFARAAASMLGARIVFGADQIKLSRD